MRMVQTPRTAYVVEVKRHDEIGPEVEKEVLERNLSLITLVLIKLQVCASQGAGRLA